MLLEVIPDLLAVSLVGNLSVELLQKVTQLFPLHDVLEDAFMFGYPFRSQSNPVNIGIALFFGECMGICQGMLMTEGLLFPERERVHFSYVHAGVRQSGAHNFFVARRAQGSLEVWGVCVRDLIIVSGGLQ